MINIDMSCNNENVVLSCLAFYCIIIYIGNREMMNLIINY